MEVTLKTKTGAEEEEAATIYIDERPGHR